MPPTLGQTMGDQASTVQGWRVPAADISISPRMEGKMARQRQQTQENPYVHISREHLFWIVGGAAITVALIQLWHLQVVSWILIGAGVLLIGVGLRHVWKETSLGQSLEEFIDQLDPFTKLSIVGGTLLLLGVLARFTPHDISLVFVILGLILFFTGSLVVIRKKDLLKRFEIDRAASQKTRLPDIETGQETASEPVSNKASPV